MSDRTVEFRGETFTFRRRLPDRPGLQAKLEAKYGDDRENMLIDLILHAVTPADLNRLASAIRKTREDDPVMFEYWLIDLSQEVRAMYGDDDG